MGYGSVRGILANRQNAADHRKKTAEGYGPLLRDKVTIATKPYAERHEDPAYLAIRGREQQMIDFHGGAQSDTAPEVKSGNKIRSVKKSNELGRIYHDSATRTFHQEKWPYTGY